MKEERQNNVQPHLEVICGPMFSGKSEELLRRLRRAQIAGYKTVLFRPKIDTTKLTHDNTRMDFIYAETIQDILIHSTTIPVGVVGIDEIQFFPDLEWVPKLATIRTVIVAGLDTTFRYDPFGDVPQLMALADKLDKLTAVCNKCGADNATRTQRLNPDGTPASSAGETVLVGEEDYYEARCRECWELA